MTVDPSSADGLGTCSEAQIGFEGPTLFDFSEAKPECPESSKIGSLELETPLIPGKIYGEVFLASQDANPFGSTFAIYVVVNDPITGVVLKIAGELKANPSTGQLTSVFDENPQLPFTHPEGPLLRRPAGGARDAPRPAASTRPTPNWNRGPRPTPARSARRSTTTRSTKTARPGSTPPSPAARRTCRAARTRPSRPRSNARTDDQELGGAEVNLPPGMLADVPSVTECGAARTRRRSRRRAHRGLSGLEQSRHRRGGRRPRPEPAVRPRQRVLDRPLQGRPVRVGGRRLREPRSVPLRQRRRASVDPHQPVDRRGDRRLRPVPDVSGPGRPRTVRRRASRSNCAASTSKSTGRASRSTRPAAPKKRSRSAARSPASAERARRWRRRSRSRTART